MKQITDSQKHCFLEFKQSTAPYSLPEKFTFPFYYDPHPLCILAAKELQVHLQTQTTWEHNFGIDPNKKGMVIGKMFGVLVVQNKDNKIGYLAAFSGKMAGQNHHTYFVPPVFDILTKDGFFNKDNEVINRINRQIEMLEQSPKLLDCQERLESEMAESLNQIAQQKQKIKSGKQARKIQRQKAKEELNPKQLETFLETLVHESQSSKIALKNLSDHWKRKLSDRQKELDQYLDAIASLKKERKVKSAILQQKLFDQYQFLNQNREKKSLSDIFQDKPPPAGAGECAAPKLLQYAFQQNMKPLAMAEFWWGQPPKSAVRKHGNFYPACRGKCEPILGHMLQGIEMDENPMLTNPAIGKEIETIYEDEHLVVINKPAEFLSVPGKTIQDSVAFRMKQKYPDATGPLIVHRLDMSTSGLMLIAKSQEVAKFLQRQFIKRTIKKRYVALLEGSIKGEEGIIDLPLRVDLDDRPRQLVCYEHGKSARTKWKVIERTKEHTKVHFYPITGRTHQLRVHAAHTLGLNTPIIGDDLYGTKANRLHLHAASIEFLHPVSRERMRVDTNPEF